MAHCLKIGLIGTGRISDIYLENCRHFAGIDIVACGSLNMDESHAKAQQYNVPRVMHPDDILIDPDIDAILNLTIPAVHADIVVSALQNGKHVYSEKPFVTDISDGYKILELAQSKGLTVGNAPDTFLGGRWQTVRKALDRGVIGTPIGVSAFVPTRGTERHHPNPDFYYAKGGGALLDMGPYYLTAFIFCLGAISRVSGMGRRFFNQRMIENGSRYGEMIPVEMDTHCLSMIEFETGVIGQMMYSFDVWDSELPRLEIYGTDGTLCIADADPTDGANIFEGSVWFRNKQTSRWSMRPRPTVPAQWQELDNTHGLNFNARGVGLAEMAQAIRENRPPRANGEMALHVCEVMDSILTSSENGQFININSRCSKPAVLQETDKQGFQVNLGA